MTQKNTTQKPKEDKKIIINFDGIAMIGLGYIAYKMYKLKLEYKAKQLKED